MKDKKLSRFQFHFPGLLGTYQCQTKKQLFFSFCLSFSVFNNLAWLCLLGVTRKSLKGQGIVMLPCRGPQAGGGVTEYALPWRRLSSHSKETFILWQFPGENKPESCFGYYWTSPPEETRMSKAWFCVLYPRQLPRMSSLLVIKCFITKRLLITFRIAFVLIIAQSIEIITRKCILFTHVLKKIFKQLIMFYILFQVRQFWN